MAALPMAFGAAAVTVMIVDLACGCGSGNSAVGAKNLQMPGSSIVSGALPSFPELVAIEHDKVLTSVALICCSQAVIVIMQRKWGNRRCTIQDRVRRTKVKSRAAASGMLRMVL
jgi:hypothetical protein